MTQEHRPVVAFVPPSCCGIGYFRPLRRALGDRIEFRPVELPGHGRRFEEPCLVTADDAVRDVAGQLGGPVDALYGESLGAYVALAVAATLGQPRPPLLFAVSNSPPSVREDMDPTEVTSIESAVAVLTGMGGEIPAEVVTDPVLAAGAFPLIRDDLLLSGSFIAGYRDTRSPGDIRVIAGLDDTASSDLTAWSRHTEADCSVLRLPGGHLISAANPSGVAQAVLDAFSNRTTEASPSYEDER
ncbi:thioesterase II family protein [Streptomyces sp. Ncost-T6T-1]|uniref:thioesterase II family protein n=1 Tax=Streptomyces sp. Ncost-T6T-1 TaxID=1100828 RepID=UPI00159EC472|nr:alpha/beta fold hydrolase [Streptomyces sp. Ncost-T6T-1]